MFRSGEEMPAAEIVERIHHAAGKVPVHKLGIVLTGGEPLLQVDEHLLQHIMPLAPAFVEIETNGTVAPKFDREAFGDIWICCSPKYCKTKPHIINGDADYWKILIPDQRRYLAAAIKSGKPVYVQPVCAPGSEPMDEVNRKALEACRKLCFDKGLRLSCQMHKLWRIP